MSVTVATIIDRTRSLIGDYGEASADVASTVTSVGTTITATDFSGFDPGGFAIVLNEWVEVTAVDKVASPNTITVRRGMRGTTGAEIAASSVIRFKAQFSGTDILSKINAALDLAYPQIYDEVTDSTTTTVANQNTYNIPTSGTPAVAVMEEVIRLELNDPNDASSDMWTVVYDWDMHDVDTVRIFGEVDASYTLRFVGRKRFSALSASGNIPTECENYAAQSYLAYMAAALCLYEQQARLGKRDAFLGMSDRFADSQPFVSGSSAREMERLARSFLTKARMHPQERYMPSAGRYYR